jgi:gamma-glutamyltranspeptidase
MACFAARCAGAGDRLFRERPPDAAARLDTRSGLTELFTGEWPTSGAVYLPGGNVPEGQKLFRNQAAADTYKRILSEAEAAGSDRQEQIQAAYDAWYKGFVAEAMDAFCRTIGGDGFVGPPP